MRIWLCALLPLAVFASVALAQPPGDVYESFKLRYSVEATDASTGVVLAVRQRDTPAGEQPPPVRKSVFTLARGTRFDTGALPICKASDAKIQRGGAGVCPAASRLGKGGADVFIGAAGEESVVVEAFNGRGQLIVVLASSTTGAVVRVIRAKIRGRTVTAVFPKVPLGEGYEAALTRFALRISRNGTRRRPWATTPENCPRTGRWRVSYTATYDEPTGPQTVRDTSPCRRG
jgi:hypothetical protein